MTISRTMLLLVSTLPALAGCATMRATPTLITTPVPATAETVPVKTHNADAADDPAIFASADNKPFPVNGTQVDALILGTDKKAGLYAYGLDGKVVQFLPEGKLNNVDLRPDGKGFVAGASNRTPDHLGVSLYRYTGAGKIEDSGFIPTDLAEPYGFCMGRHDGKLIAVLIGKDGAVREYALSTDADGTLDGKEIARFSVGSQSEGCVVDDATGMLYLGEEDFAVWRYPLGASDGQRLLVARTGKGALVADIEGISLLADGSKKYLIVSSQGDSAFALWRIDGAQPDYVGRVHITAANGVNDVTGTDGVDARGGPVGSYPDGLVVVQDDVNEGGTQNFKLVDWRTIRNALGL